MLDGLQRAAFDYFVRHTNRDNGLVADTSRPGPHASIAVVGFALSAYPVGVERGVLKYDWQGSSEAILLYVRLGSPTHPLTAASFPAWTGTYDWERHSEQTMVNRDFAGKPACRFGLPIPRPARIGAAA